MNKYFPKMISKLWKILQTIFPPIPTIEGIKIGKNSVIIKPRQIDGQKKIFVGNQTTIMTGAWISAYEKFGQETYTPTISIGNNVYIGGRACITSINKITIGDGCVISEDVYISDHVHGYNPEHGYIAKQPLISKGEVVIGDNNFIGFRVCVLPGVSLGRNCVVGANSVVTKSFPDFSMIAGVPARLIKVYSFERHDWIDPIDNS